MASASKKKKEAPASVNKTRNNAKKATPAPVTKTEQKETPKAKRPPAVIQNGVQRPRPGGLCAAVWEITENLAKDGEMPTIAQVKEIAAKKGLNPTNVSIEYYRCRQFHGVRGRLKKKTEQEQKQA